MSMDYSGWFAYVMKPEDVKKLAPQCFERLEKAFDKYDMNLDRAAYLIECDYDENDDCSVEILDIVLGITEYIKNVYNIKIYLDYCDEDNGGPYDDIRGAYWNVDFSTIYEPTIAYRNLIEMGINIPAETAVAFG